VAVVGRACWLCILVSLPSSPLVSISLPKFTDREQPLRLPPSPQPANSPVDCHKTYFYHLSSNIGVPRVIRRIQEARIKPATISPTCTDSLFPLTSPPTSLALAVATCACPESNPLRVVEWSSSTCARAHVQPGEILPGLASLNHRRILRLRHTAELRPSCK
jgi:hypothetical protein